MTAGLSKYLKIPGITKGSHSYQQVAKSGFTKAIKYQYNISLKVIGKAAVYLFVSGFTIGMLISNAITGFINAQIIRFKENQNINYLK